MCSVCLSGLGGIDLRKTDPATLTAYLSTRPAAAYANAEEWLAPTAERFDVKPFIRSGLPQDKALRNPFGWIPRAALKAAVDEAFLEWGRTLDGGRPRGQGPSAAQRLSTRISGDAPEPDADGLSRLPASAMRHDHWGNRSSHVVYAMRRRMPWRGGDE